mgnify:FL=1
METGDTVEVGNLTIMKTGLGWLAFDGDFEPMPLPKLWQLGAQFWCPRHNAFRVPGGPVDRWTHDKFTVCDAILEMLPGYDPSKDRRRPT